MQLDKQQQEHRISFCYARRHVGATLHLESSHLLSVQAALHPAVCKVCEINLSQLALLLVFRRYFAFAFSSRIRELRLGGWSKIGFPGVIVVEGGEM